MGLLARFDLSTDLTRFFLGGLIIFMLFAVVLTFATPKNGARGRPGGGRVDDRFTSFDGELID